MAKQGSLGFIRWAFARVARVARVADTARVDGLIEQPPQILPTSIQFYLKDVE